MQKNKLLPVFIFIFILFSFLGNKAYASNVNISADKLNITTSEEAIITVTIGNTNEQIVFLTSSPAGGAFNPKDNCITTEVLPIPMTGSRCSVKFYSVTPGTFNIQATHYENNVPQLSNIVQIKVTKSTNQKPQLKAVIISNHPEITTLDRDVKLKITGTPVPISGPVVTVTLPGGLTTICTISALGTTPGDGSCVPYINLPTGIAGTYEVIYSTNNWPGITEIISGKITITVKQVDMLPPIPPITIGIQQCGDSKDNDGDKLTDKDDPDCHTDNDAKNASTYVGKRNEGNLYHFLAPLKCDEGTPGCVDGQLKVFDPGQKNALGTYLNIMIKILIGLAAVLAVIMIVMGGIQYMTSELISSKEEGKKRITNALIGLLIALGAYILLFTINPNLLNIEPNPDTFTNVVLDYSAEENITEVGPGINIGGTHVGIKKGKTADCKGGLVDLPKEFPSESNKKREICKDLLEKLYILKSLFSGWEVTSTVSGKHSSPCHAKGNSRSGNCVDLQILGDPRGSGYTKTKGSMLQKWGDLCVAIAKTGGLSFLNEASGVNACMSIQPYRTYPTTSGPNIHINFIGS